MGQESEALAVAETTAITRSADNELSVKEIVARVHKVHEVQREVMKEGQHYGKVPGVDKPTLLKPGAEILGMVFRLAPEFELAENLRDGQHLRVTVKCSLVHIPTGAVLGSGMGSCSTYESKYRYRKAERACPECGKPAIIKGKAEYGGGWVCFKKKDGCGAKFDDHDPDIVGQEVGRIENPDLADQHNTVLKMAIKRAHVAAILFVTCASEIFTQDAEDMRGEGPAKPASSPTNGGSKGRAAGKPAPPADLKPRIAKLLNEYPDAVTETELDGLDEERKELWAHMSRSEKQSAKSAAEMARERIRLAGEPGQGDDDIPFGQPPAGAGDAWEGDDGEARKL